MALLPVKLSPERSERYSAIHKLATELYGARIQVITRGGLFTPSIDLEQAV
jgi:hypothetical protein